MCVSYTAIKLIFKMTEKSRKIIIKTFKEEGNAKKFLSHLQSQRRSSESEEYYVPDREHSAFGEKGVLD